MEDNYICCKCEKERTGEPYLIHPVGPKDDKRLKEDHTLKLCYECGEKYHKSGLTVWVEKIPVGLIRPKSENRPRDWPPKKGI